ncbi:MAG: VOC family protein [Thermoplasmata archaeon]|nr:VOC family protein [Thermoplasmata archaeon]
MPPRSGVWSQATRRRSSAELGHLSLEVADLDRSVPFYDRLLSRIGFRRSSRAPEHAVYRSDFLSVWLLRGSPPRVTRTPPTGEEPVLAEHIAFRVESPARLLRIERGLEREGIYPLFYGEERPELRSGYIATTWLDPDGFALELFAVQPPKGAAAPRARKPGSRKRRR